VSTYRERLWAPWWLWLVAAAFAATFGIAFAVPLGTAWGGGALLVAEGVVAAALGGMSVLVEVRDDQLVAGRARLPLTSMGRVTPLDAEAARTLRGVGADPRAYLVLRGWVPTAVRIDLDDPADPTPYWYVSTRHPDRLAAALGGRRSADRRA
jgi:hypothetical protein